MILASELGIAMADGPDTSKDFGYHVMSYCSVCRCLVTSYPYCIQGSLLVISD